LSVIGIWKFPVVWPKRSCKQMTHGLHKAIWDKPLIWNIEKDETYAEAFDCSAGLMAESSRRHIEGPFLKK
jgi:hypothetical protein